MCSCSLVRLRKLVNNRILITCFPKNTLLTHHFCVDGCRLDETPQDAELLSGCSPCYSFTDLAALSHRARRHDHDQHCFQSCCCLHRLWCFHGTELLRFGTLTYRLWIVQSHFVVRLLIRGPCRPTFELLACFVAF